MIARASKNDRAMILCEADDNITTAASLAVANINRIRGREPDFLSCSVPANSPSPSAVACEAIKYILSCPLEGAVLAINDCRIFFATNDHVLIDIFHVPISERWSAGDFIPDLALNTVHNTATHKSGVQSVFCCSGPKSPELAVSFRTICEHVFGDSVGFHQSLLSNSFQAMGKCLNIFNCGGLHSGNSFLSWEWSDSQKQIRMISDFYKTNEARHADYSKEQFANFRESGPDVEYYETA